MMYRKIQQSLEQSTQILMDLSHDYYLVNNQEDIIKQLESFEDYLKSQGNTWSTLKKKLNDSVKNMLSIEESSNTAQTESTKFINIFNEHKRALLLENAQLHQHINSLEKQNHAMQDLLSTLTNHEKEQQSLSQEALEHKNNVLQQIHIINMAMTALIVTIDKNKSLVNELNSLSHNSISAYTVHEIVKELQT